MIDHYQTGEQKNLRYKSNSVVRPPKESSFVDNIFSTIILMMYLLSTLKTRMIIYNLRAPFLCTDCRSHCAFLLVGFKKNVRPVKL